MARKGVEPAGLRKYRLAQKRKNRPKRRVTKMAKKQGKKRNYRRSARKARRTRKIKHIIPLLSVAAPAISTAYVSLTTGQGLKGVALNEIYQYTGYNASNNTWMNPIGAPDEAGRNLKIAVVGIGGSMLARKLKLNKYIPLPKGWKLF